MRLIFNVACLLFVVLQFIHSQPGIDDINILAIQINSPYKDAINYISKIKDQLRQDLAKNLVFDENDIILKYPATTQNDTFYIQIMFDTPSRPYFDSFSTPDSYSYYASKLQEFTSSYKEITIITDGTNTISFPIASETAFKHLSYPIDENKYFKSEIRQLEYVPSYDIQQHIQETSRFTLQLKVLEPITVFEQSPGTYAEFLELFSNTASTILDVTPTAIICSKFIDENDAATIVQFTVDPQISSDEEGLSELWRKAVTQEHEAFANLKRPIDYSFASVVVKPTATPPPRPENITTTTTTQSPSAASTSTSSGVIAGSVCGALAGAALLGGGGYFLMRKYKKSPIDEPEHEPSDSAA